MVIRLGFEPKTHSLEGCCSIQLSYQTIFFGCKDTAFFQSVGRLYAKKLQIVNLIPQSWGRRGDADAWA